MMDDQFTPEEQQLIQQLRTTPRAKLKDSTREAIRQQVMNEFRIAAGTAQQSRIPRVLRPRLVVWFAAAAGAVAITTVIGLMILQIGIQQTEISGTTTISASPGNQVAVVPSETLESTDESLILTVSVTPTPSMTSEITPEITVTTALPTEASTPVSLTPTPTEKTVVVEGPITNIVNNIITIYDFNIEVEAHHPILNLIDVGDLVRVEGAFGSDGVIVANVVSNITSTTAVNNSVNATVNLEGPVEAIAGDLVTVNGIQAQLDPASPVFRTLQVGNFVSVQGDFQASGATIVLVVVSFTVIDSETTIENDCWYHDTGMGMGHWHCDGMGMGMGMEAMGMEAMGMGE
jgi:hypothetical protein